MLVVGSSKYAEPGPIRLSSKTNRLVHSATIPVAVAPRGYRNHTPVRRLTIGFRDQNQSWSLLEKTAEIFRRTNAKLRLFTFVVNPSRKPVAAPVSHTETPGDQDLEQPGSHRVENAEEYLASLGFTGEKLERRLARSEDWAGALKPLHHQDPEALLRYFRIGEPGLDAGAKQSLHLRGLQSWGKPSLPARQTKGARKAQIAGPSIGSRASGGHGRADFSWMPSRFALVRRMVPQAVARATRLPAATA